MQLEHFWFAFYFCDLPRSCESWLILKKAKSSAPQTHCSGHYSFVYFGSFLTNLTKHSAPWCRRCRLRLLDFSGWLRYISVWAQKQIGVCHFLAMKTKRCAYIFPCIRVEGSSSFLNFFFVGGGETSSRKRHILMSAVEFLWMAPECSSSQIEKYLWLTTWKLNMGPVNMDTWLSDFCALIGWELCLIRVHNYESRSQNQSHL